MRERYAISRITAGVNSWYSVGGGNDQPFATYDGARTWIDEQAARACLESVLPVGDELARAVIASEFNGCEPDNLASAFQCDFATAIRHITTGGDDAV